MTDEATLAAIRARVAKDDQQRAHIVPALAFGVLYEDRATLLAALDEMRAKLEVHPSGYDGIASRDETIRQQERVIEGLRAELDGYRANAEQLERWVEERDAEIERMQQRERALREALEKVAVADFLDYPWDPKRSASAIARAALKARGEP